MIKLLLFLVLIFATLSVNAKWLLMNEDDEVSIYIETNSIKRKDNVVTYWKLFDYSVEQTFNNINYFSSKEKYETNCNTEEGASLLISFTSAKMGKGKSVYSYKAEQKNFIPNIPDTIGYTIYKFVCKRK